MATTTREYDNDIQSTTKHDDNDYDYDFGNDDPDGGGAGDRAPHPPLPRPQDFAVASEGPRPRAVCKVKGIMVKGSCCCSGESSCGECNSTLNMMLGRDAVMASCCTVDQDCDRNVKIQSVRNHVETGREATKNMASYSRKRFEQEPRETTQHVQLHEANRQSTTAATLRTSMGPKHKSNRVLNPRHRVCITSSSQCRGTSRSSNAGGKGCLRPSRPG